MAGVWCGADKFSRVGHLAADPLLPEVLGTEALPSQPTLTRFFRGFNQHSNTAGFGKLSRWICGRLPSQRGGYTLDLDSTAIVHEDGHQEGVRVGYTPRGLKPSHHPLLAALAEAKLVCGFWLRSGHAATLNNARAFLDHTLAHLPAQVRVGLVRADAGFCSAEFLGHLRARGLDYIVVTPLHTRLRQRCRHEEAAWTPTGVPGLAGQEVEGAELAAPGRRVILLRQRVVERPEAGGKPLLEVPGYRFQAAGHLAAAFLEPGGRLAALQRPGRHRKSHQGTGSPVWAQEFLLPEVLGHRSGLPARHCRLQPLRALPTSPSARPTRSNCKPCASDSSAGPPFLAATLKAAQRSSLPSHHHRAPGCEGASKNSSPRSPLGTAIQLTPSPHKILRQLNRSGLAHRTNRTQQTDSDKEISWCSWTSASAGIGSEQRTVVPAVGRVSNINSAPISLAR